MSFERFGWSKPRHYNAEAYDRAIAVLGATQEASEGEITERISELRSLTASQKRQRRNGLLRCELELLLLHRSTDEDLAQSIPELRREFALVKGRPPVKAAVPEGRPALMAEARFLTLEVLRHRDLQEMFVRSKASTVWRIALPVLLAFPVAAVLVWLSGHDPKMRDPTVLVVMLSGACGGFVSLCRRIEALEPGRDLVRACRALQANGSGLIAKPLLGGAFALVLYLMMLGGLVTGSLFPAIHVSDGSMSFYTFFNARMTAGAGDFAKLLVWSFVAGFAERFVPDILEKVAGAATKGAVRPGRSGS